jgi:hypothetical protein
MSGDEQLKVGADRDFVAADRAAFIDGSPLR